ncbi:MAG TPA: OmpA family protein [Usitatibacter sp.]|jgi:OOP family OmpA-OmpF porin|nr:OmpA family protein [Usitatibacter sp.]
MKISNKLMLGGAIYALAASMAYAQTPQPVLEDGQGRAVLDGSGNCVLTSGRILPECGPAAPPPAKPAAPAEPAAPAVPAPAPAPAPARPAPSSVRQSVVIQADALFDFDKAVVRPDGKRAIDEALSKLNGVDVEMVIATGHTDSIGTARYNQRLSERRAAAVKQYLESKGIAGSKITTIGKGETQPVATNKTAEGRQKNRRVDIEFKGTKQ